MTNGLFRAMIATMDKREYEVVVIGGGSGGYAAASKLAGYGLSTALIEKADELGGLCILRGCMPSKALIESANLMRRMRRSAEFGIHTSGLEISMGEVQDRKQRLIGGFQKYRADQLENGNFDLIRGEAAFVSEKEIKVVTPEGTRRLDFDYAVIATGSVPFVPEIDGLEEIDFWLSKDALETREIPEHLVVIGGGAIGCEMAHCFEGLGSQVTVLQRSGCLLNDFDTEIGKTISEVSRKRGIRVLCSTIARRVRRSDGDGIVLEIESEGKREEISASHLLIATGRKPASERLGLEAAGVETEKSRVKVNQHRQTNRSHIFGIGDSSNELPVVHKAVIEGEDVARYIAIETGKTEGGISSGLSPDLELFGIFTHPECARIGMTHQQISEDGLETKSATYPFSDHGKAEIIGETEGFVKIISEKDSGKILSASAVGPHVIDLIHELQVAIHAGLTVSQFAAIPHYHPTLSEIWTYPAEELIGR